MITSGKARRSEGRTEGCVSTIIFVLDRRQRKGESSAMAEGKDRIVDRKLRRKGERKARRESTIGMEVSQGGGSIGRTRGYTKPDRDSQTLGICQGRILKHPQRIPLYWLGNLSILGGSEEWTWKNSIHSSLTEWISIAIDPDTDHPDGFILDTENLTGHLIGHKTWYHIDHRHVDIRRMLICWCIEIKT